MIRKSLCRWFIILYYKSHVAKKFWNQIESNRIKIHVKSNQNSSQIESKFKSNRIKMQIKSNWKALVKCLKVYLRYCQHATIQMGIEIVDVPKFVDLHGKHWLVSPNFSFSVSNLEHRWWKLPHPMSKQPRWSAVRGHYGILKPIKKRSKFKYCYI